MRILSQLTFITYIGNVKYNRNLINNIDDNRRRINDLHIFNLNSKSSETDSFDDFFKEEDYKHLPPEQQLEKLNEDKILYNSIQRLVKKSKECQLPETKITSQTIYPPPDNNDEKEDLPELYNKNYKPIKTELKSNTTLELLPSIVQKPHLSKDTINNVKDTKLEELNTNLSKIVNDNKHFKIADDLNDGLDVNYQLHENEIYLKEINKRLKKQNRPTIKVNDTNELGELTPEKKMDIYNELDKNELFVEELRKLKLEKAINYRKFLNHMRKLRKANLNTYFFKLPKDKNNFTLYEIEDLNKFKYEEMQEELRNRGYRCSYDENTLKKMLIDIKENEDDYENVWRLENIVKQELKEDNMNLNKYSREKLKQLNESLNIYNNTGVNNEMSVKIKRLQILIDLFEFYTDPVSYLDLDRDLYKPDKEEMTKIQNAPILYDTTFIEEMSRPITKLPDLVPRTYNLQEDYVNKFPITTINKADELDNLKKEYLTIQGGIHQQTLPEISERFEISIDFLGDACCRLGAFAPIHLDKELRGIISYSAIWDLLQFLNICDSAEIQLFYTHLSLKDISKKLKVKLKDIHDILNKLNVKLPFGDDTKLNLTCLKALESYIDIYYK